MIARLVAAAIALGVVAGVIATGGAQPAPPAPVASPPRAPTTLAVRRDTKTHNGFVADMDCSACHTEESWKLSATAGKSGFDHDRTGFPLRASHTRAQCSRCHTGRAKPSTSCDGCHKDPHQGRHDGGCAECHTAVTWSDTATLEQHRRTRLPLTGKHATLDCQACHRRNAGAQFANTPADCFACHREDYRRAETPHRHDGTEAPAPFSRECSRCHQTSGWSPAFVDPDTILRGAARTNGHDRAFVLSTGSHRTADCAGCHLDPRRSRLVRCDGCHTAQSLRARHRAPVAVTAAACLRCHPRGAAR